MLFQKLNISNKGVYKTELIYDKKNFLITLSLEFLMRKFLKNE